MIEQTMIEQTATFLDLLDLPTTTITTLPKVLGGHYTDRDKLLEDVAKHNGNLNIYFGLNEARDVTNTLKPGLKTSDDDIVRRHTFSIDVDRKVKDGFATAEECQGAIAKAKEIREHLYEKGFPHPVLMCSGNGAALIYRIDLDPDSHAVSDVLEYCQRFNDDQFEVDLACSDAARIYRLPGTWNTKYADQRQAAMLEYPQRLEVVESDLFSQFQRDRKPNTKNSGERKESPLDLPRLIRSLELIESHDRKTWIDVGLALKNERDNLFPVWEWWSKLSHKSRDCDLAGEWANLNPDGRITLGTIFHRGTKSTEGIKFQSFDQFMAADFHIEWLIPDILVKGQPMIVGGPPKVFKTSLVLNMSLALAAGTEFLGRKCEKTGVAFATGESGEAAIQDTIRRQLPTLGATPANFHITTQLPKFYAPLDEWESVLGDLGVGIFVVDPAYMCMNGDEAANLLQMGQQLKNVSDVASRLGVTLIICHHSTKAAARENKPLSLTDLSWAGFAEWARQWFLLSHRKPYRDGLAQLFLNAGGSAGHNNLLQLDVDEGITPRTWDVTAKTNREATQDREEERYQEAVQKVREVVTEPMCKTPIRDKAGIRSKDFDSFFPRMLEEGVVSECGKRGPNPMYEVAAC